MASKIWCFLRLDSSQSRTLSDMMFQPCQTFLMPLQEQSLDSPFRSFSFKRSDIWMCPWIAVLHNLFMALLPKWWHLIGFMESIWHGPPHPLVCCSFGWQLREAVPEVLSHADPILQEEALQGEAPTYHPFGAHPKWVPQCETPTYNPFRARPKWGSPVRMGRKPLPTYPCENTWWLTMVGPCRVFH